VLDLLINSGDCVVYRAVTLPTSQDCSDAPVWPCQRGRIWVVGQRKTFNWGRLAQVSLRQRC